MQKAINKNINLVIKNSLSICIAVFSAIALPQLFHAFGLYTGMGDKFGQMFLPMYLPVLILAFKSNSLSGVIAGILSPIISFSLSGMPTAAMMPFIIVELITFGIFAGLLANKELNIFLKIVIVQVLGRIVRIAATLISVYFINNTTITATAILTPIILAVPGYILQLLVVPYFIRKRNF